MNVLTRIALLPALCLLWVFTAPVAEAVTHADPSDDVAAVKARTLAWVKGWHTAPETPFDIDTVARLYAKDTFSSFDFGRPSQGFQDWPKAAAYYQRFMELPRTWDLSPLGTPSVTIRGNIAWATLALEGRGTLADGAELHMLEARVTLIFERIDGVWLIVHEHGSQALAFPDAATLSDMLTTDAGSPATHAPEPQSSACNEDPLTNGCDRVFSRTTR